MPTRYQCPEGLGPDGTINPQWLMAEVPLPAASENPAGFERFLGLTTPPGAESLPDLQSPVMGSLGSPSTSNFESPATQASPLEFMSDTSTDMEFVSAAQTQFPYTTIAHNSHINFTGVLGADAALNDTAILDSTVGVMSHIQGPSPDFEPYTQDICRRTGSFTTIDMGSLDQSMIHAAPASWGDQPVTQNDNSPMQTHRENDELAIDSNGNFKCLHRKKDGKVCGKIYDTRGKYRKHKKIHDKRRVCGLCGHKVVGGKDLDRHMNAHHKAWWERPSFPCEHCDQKFTRNDNLRRHTTKKHPRVSL